MIYSIGLFLLFLAGIGCGWLGLLPSEWFGRGDIEMVLIDVLLLLVGIGIGSEIQQGGLKNALNWKQFLVPLAVGIGSLGGGLLVTLINHSLSWQDGLALGSGFGYYSLSSILITQIKGSELGMMALLANMFRELFTILFSPILTKYFGKLAPIASGGATSMDVTLPVIRRTVGEQYTMVSIVNGVVLSLLVPILVPLILGM